LVYPENIGKHLSIDEVALSQGELYTVVTNKKAKGRAGSIVAIIAVQEIRIKYRWQAIDQENEIIQRAKKQQLQYRA